MRVKSKTTPIGKETAWAATWWCAWRLFPRTPQKDSCFLGSRIQLEDDEIIIFSSFMRGSEYVVEYVVEGTRDPWI